MNSFPPLRSATRYILFFLLVLFTGCGINTLTVKEGIPRSVPFVPSDSIAQTLFLIGDAGQPLADGSEPTFRILRDAVRVAGEQTSIIFLGDDLYPKGLPVAGAIDRTEMERRLREQAMIAAGLPAETYFVPGNHDWREQGPDGWQTVKREVEFLKDLKLPNVRMLPEEGMPGPCVVDRGDLRLVLIDTQWWLHRFAKPLYAGDSTVQQSERHFVDSLGSSLAISAGKTVVVAGHHPIVTYGEHGGFFDWKDHLFPLRKLVSWLWLPLPGLGSLYPLSRQWGISDQDLSHEQNRRMTVALDSVMRQYPVTIYAAGHEHTLQVIRNDAPQTYLVSGHGIVKHQEALTTGEFTIAASPSPGFMKVEILKNGRVRMAIVETGTEEGVEVFSMFLR